MGLKKTDPAVIQQYGNAAQGHFDTIRTTLQTLVNDCVNVQYFGGNSVQFKTQAGEMTRQFGASFSQKMAALASNISSSTTAISTSLGGPPITISVDGTPPDVPAPAPDTGVSEVETTALEGLITTVNGHFQAINSTLDANVASLNATDEGWIGNAKEATRNAVSAFTNAQKTATAEAQAQVVKFINEQISSVETADSSA